MARKILADTVDADAAVDRLIAWYRAATAAEHRDGRRWYPRARHVAAQYARESSATVAQAAGVIAALSPQVEWLQCLQLARDALATGARGHYGLQCQKADACAAAPTRAIGRILGGPKTRAFWACILRPTAQWVVPCIDRHAVAAAVGDSFAHPARLTRGKNYLRVARWYATAAARVGVPPAEFQAVVWVVYRHRVAGLLDSPDWAQAATAAPF